MLLRGGASNGQKQDLGGFVAGYAKRAACDAKQVTLILHRRYAAESTRAGFSDTTARCSQAPEGAPHEC